MKLIALTTLLCFGIIVFGQEKTHHYNVNKNKLALDGWDPVSYFQTEPREGSSQFSYTYKGVVYYFASSKNKDAFKANPSKYLPEYGGWCAYAMGKTGEKVEVDPETYKIVDGKLYLFYNKFFTNTLDDWNENEANLKQNADQNWLNLK